MKSFKLREEKTFIKILKEPPVQKKPFNWSRLVYIMIFVFIFGNIARRVYQGNAIIFADGQIELPKQTINLPYDIEVLELRIEEGDQVSKGDTLFKYKIFRDEVDKANFEMKNQSDSWIIKEILSLEKKTKLNELLIKNHKDHLKLLDKNLEQKESLLLVGIHSEYNQYSQLQNTRSEVIAKIEFLNKEIQLLKNHIYRLKQNEKMSLAFSQSNVALYDKVNYFVAPIDGIVSDVFYEVNENCYKKDEMMSIHQLKDASIITYFDTDEINNLKVGDQVDIAFPDGKTQKGIIDKFFVSTYALPSEFQKKYEPTERNIVAQVIPLTTSQENSWLKFYKMEVKVTKNRYPFL